MVVRPTRSALALAVASLSLVGGGTALAVQGHHPRHLAPAHHARAASLVQECVAAKAAGSAAATRLCAAANDAANPPLSPAQLARLQTLSRECVAAKAAGSTNTAACAEANALAGA